MKKLSLFIALLAFFSFSAMSAESDLIKAKKNLKEQIFEKVDHSVHNVEGNVRVFFEISEDNTVILHNIIAESDELENYVRNCMKDCELETEDFMKGRIFEIELDFYLL